MKNNNYYCSHIEFNKNKTKIVYPQTHNHTYIVGIVTDYIYNEKMSGQEREKIEDFKYSLMDGSQEGLSNNKYMGVKNKLKILTLDLFYNSMFELHKNPTNNNIYFFIKPEQKGIIDIKGSLSNITFWFQRNNPEIEKIIAHGTQGCSFFIDSSKKLNEIDIKDGNIIYFNYNEILDVIPKINIVSGANTTLKFSISLTTLSNQYTMSQMPSGVTNNDVDDTRFLKVIEPYIPNIISLFNTHIKDLTVPSFFLYFLTNNTKKDIILDNYKFLSIEDIDLWGNTCADRISKVKNANPLVHNSFVNKNIILRSDISLKLLMYYNNYLSESNLFLSGYFIGIELEHGSLSIKEVKDAHEIKLGTLRYFHKKIMDVHIETLYIGKYETLLITGETKKFNLIIDKIVFEEHSIFDEVIINNVGKMKISYKQQIILEPITTIKKEDVAYG